jgi:hypothetical protein
MIFYSWRRYKEKLNEKALAINPDNMQDFKQHYVAEITESDEDVDELDRYFNGNIKPS